VERRLSLRARRPTPRRLLPRGAGAKASPFGRLSIWWYQRGASRGITPVSDEHGKSQPLRALCLLFRAIDETDSPSYDTKSGHRKSHVPPLHESHWGLPALSFQFCCCLLDISTVRWSWRPHSRCRRCFRLHSLCLIPRFRAAFFPLKRCLLRWTACGCPGWRHRSCRRSETIEIRPRVRVAHLPVFRCSHCPGCRWCLASASSSVSASGPRRICETRQQELIGAKEYRGDR